MSELWFGLTDNPALGLSLTGDTPPDPTAPVDTTPTPTTKEPTMDLWTPAPWTIDLGHVYHVAYPTPKCDENSARGIRYAHDHGWSIDIDMQKDKNGTPLADHWQDLMVRDGWYDPEHKLNKNRTLNSLEPFQWSRLTTKHGDRLLTMDEAIRMCGRLGVKMRIEPKAGNGWSIADATHMHDVATEAGTKVVVATLTNDPYWRHRLATFRAGGFADTRRL